MKNPKILKTLSRKSVCLFQASSNYTYLFFEGGRKEISAYTLKTFEGMKCNQDFVKIDRSNLVKEDFISGIIRRNNKLYVKLINQLEIPIPRRRKKEIMLEYPQLFKLS
jgi:DNA-binding LytR/AlgR family response regulator